MARDFTASAANYLSFTLKSFQTTLATTSYSWWCKADTNGQYRGVFNKGAGYPSRDANNEYDNTFGYVYTQDFSSNRGGWSISAPATGSWFQIVITHDMSLTTNDPIIYKDGVSQAITERYTPSGTANNTATAFQLGKSDTGAPDANTWDGLIAEFAIWNRILTADEALGLGKGFSPLFYLRGLVFYVPIVGRQSPETEVIGASTGTINGTIGAADHPKVFYPVFGQNRRFTTGAAGGGEDWPHFQKRGFWNWDFS